MANISLSDLSELAKEQYTSEKVQNLVNHTAVTYGLLKKDKTSVKRVGGRGLVAYEAFQATSGAGSYWGTETGALPAASSLIHERLEISANKRMSATISITQTALQVGGQDALVDALAHIRKDIVDGIVPHINRALYAGRTGQLAKVAAAVSASATVTVDSTRLLARGMRIVTSSSNTALAQTADQDISQGVTSTTDDAYVVGTKDSATQFTLYNNAMTASQTDTVSVDRNIYKAGDIDASGNNTMASFKSLLDNYSLRATSSWDADGSSTQTIQGVDKTTIAGGFLEVEVAHNSNVKKAFLEKDLEKLIDEIEVKKIGATKVLITTAAIKREIAAQFKELLSVGGNSYIDLPFGHKALAYQYQGRVIPVVTDMMAIPNTILALDTDHIKFYVGKDFGWDEDPSGGNLFQRVLNSSARPTPVYEAFYTVFLNLGCNRFDVQGIMRDISEA